MSFLALIAILIIGMIVTREAAYLAAPHLHVALHRPERASGPTSGLLAVLGIQLTGIFLTAVAIAHAALTLMGGVA